MQERPVVPGRADAACCGPSVRRLKDLDQVTSAPRAACAKKGWRTFGTRGGAAVLARFQAKRGPVRRWESSKTPATREPNRKSSCPGPGPQCGSLVFSTNLRGALGRSLGVTHRAPNGPCRDVRGRIWRAACRLRWRGGGALRRYRLIEGGRSCEAHCRSFRTHRPRCDRPVCKSVSVPRRTAIPRRNACLMPTSPRKGYGKAGGRSGLMPSWTGAECA